MSTWPNAHSSPFRFIHARGFTLIEILIAVAIVGILSTIAYPAYTQYVRKSHRPDAKNALLDLSSREERYFSINNAYTTSASALGYGTNATFPIPIASSGQSYYSMTVTQSASNNYVATATPTGTQVSDSCNGYVLDYLGNQTNVDGSSNTISSSGCW